MEHAIRVVTQPGPGTSSSTWAYCTCGWRSGFTKNRDQAEEEGNFHIESMHLPREDDRGDDQ